MEASHLTTPYLNVRSVTLMCCSSSFDVNHFPLDLAKGFFPHVTTYI
jgi:hypothetical protein